MNRGASVQFAHKIVAAWKEYLTYAAENGHTSHPDKKSDWTHTDTHCSAVSKCPKAAAVKLNKAFEFPQADDFGMLRMLEGTSMGKVFAEAMYHAGRDISTQPFGVLNHEQEVRGEQVRGSVDVLLITNAGESVPVEVKLTNAWKYNGVTVDMFVQTAMYVRLIREADITDGTLRPCDTGVIFTIYDDKTAGVAHRPWIVQYIPENHGFILYDDQGSTVGFEGFPLHPRFKYVFLSDHMLDEMIIQHREWYEEIREGKPLEDNAPYDSPTETLECAYWKAAAPRKTKWTDPKTGIVYPAGSAKKGTGQMYIRCPLFKLCWKSWSAKRGIDPDSTEAIMLPVEGEEEVEEF